MKSRWKYIAAGSIAFFAAAAFFSVKKNAPLAWKQGARQSYQISSSSVMQSASSDIQRLNERLDISGTLNMKVCDVYKDKIIAAFQLSPLTVKVSGKEVPALEKNASNLFFAEISPEGKFEKFRFNGSEISAEDSRAIRDVVKSAEFIVKKYSLFGRTEDINEDPDGKYVMGYSYGETVAKKKKSFAAAGPGKQRAEIKRSEGHAVYDSEHSWLVSADYSDFIVFYSMEKAMLKVSSRITMKLIETSSADLDIWKDSSDYASVSSWKDEGGEGSLRKSALSLSLDEFRKQALALLKKFRKYDPDCLAKLIALINACPEAADIIPSLVIGNEFSVDGKLMLVHALERTGTPRAEKNLVIIMREPATGIEARMQAIVGLGTFKNVSSDTTDALWSAFKGKENNQFRNAALLSMGAIAKSDSSENESSVIKKRIRQEYSSASGTNEKSALLLAAGNTADTEMIPLLKEGLTDSNPHIRASAASALHYMDDGKSNNILTEKLQDESNANVRKTIVSTMYDKSADESTTDAVFSALKKEDNDNVRTEMYRYLLKNRDVDGVKKELETILSSEKSITNRNLIITALGTKKQSGKTAAENPR